MHYTETMPYAAVSKVTSFGVLYIAIVSNYRACQKHKEFLFVPVRIIHYSISLVLHKAMKSTQTYLCVDFHRLAILRLFDVHNMQNLNLQ